MIHLIKKIYADYSFVGVGDKSNAVYINELGSYPFSEGDEPLDQYGSLKEVFQKFGDLTTFLEYLLPLEEKIILLLDEDDLNQLHVALIKAIYPELDVRMVHRILKLSVVNHKYTMGFVPENRGRIRDYYSALKIPPLSKVQMWVHRVRDQKPLPEALKHLVSFEYMLANALVNDFSPDDPYIQSFVERMDTILWKSVAWDFASVRRDVLYGLYNVRKNFGYAIDLERDDIEAQIERYQDRYLFNPEANASRVDLIKAHFTEIREAILKVERFNKTSDSIEEAVLEVLLDGTLTLEEVKRLIALDRTMHASQLFGRTEFQNNMNNVFISYLYQAKPSELRGLSLS